jgi:nickel-dependent lactate racemase
VQPRSPISLPYGPSRFDLTVEADLLVPPHSTPVADEAAAIRQALDEPIGTPPLAEVVKPGETVAIVVNDITRLARSDLMLPPIVNTLNRAGVPDKDIFIVFALGTHRPQTEDERQRIVGNEIYGRVEMFDHIGSDDASLVTVGTTTFGNVVEINRRVWEADRIVLTGEIIYHMIAGYSGGRKSLIPGVAGNRTTTFNHRMIFDARVRPGALDGNPAHEDLLEACRMVEPDFIVNLILSPEGKLLRVFAGDYRLAHRAGCKQVDELLATGIDEPYDVVIASAGGDPLDIDIRQAHKGMENACRALKPGGSLFYYAECSNGGGSAKLDEFLSRYDDDRQMEQTLRERFVVGGHKAYWLTRLGRLYDVHLVSALDPSYVARCHFKPVAPAEHETQLRALLRKKGSGARVAVIPHAGFTMPRQRLFREGT